MTYTHFPDPGTPPPAPTAEPWRALFSPGERLGWMFRDRYSLIRPYGEPPPDLAHIHNDLHSRFSQSVGSLSKHIVPASIIGGVGLMCCCGGILITSGSTSSDQAGLLPLGMLAVLFAGLATWVVLVVARRKQARDRVASVGTTVGRIQQAWEQRAGMWYAQETARVDPLDEWGSAGLPPGTKRLDILGGGMWSWEAFLTIFGASLLGAQSPLLVVDLSREFVCGELMRLAETAGYSVDGTVLPEHLAESDMLDGLTPQQLVDALIAAMYGDQEVANRAERTMDSRLLTSIVEVLGSAVTLARISAALRILGGQYDRGNLLTPKEQDTIANGLLADDFRRDALNSVRRMEAHLYPLSELGTRRRDRTPANLTCLALDNDAGSPGSELLTDLLVQWLMRLIANDSVSARTLIITYADHLQALHLERLADLCERRHLRLVLLFRNLRDASLRVMGGGAVGFMKLSQHEEAAKAAEFIGRQHKFVFSQLTQTLGGNETHGESVSETESESNTHGINTSFGRSTNHTRPEKLGFMEDPRTRGSVNNGTNTSRSISRSLTTTRSWTTTLSYSEGTNWSTAASQERVYEFAVEPTVLQGLPDYGMLLVERKPGGLTVRPVEANPEILLLPRVSLLPLPFGPVPDMATPGQAHGTSFDRASQWSPPAPRAVSMLPTGQPQILAPGPNGGGIPGPTQTGSHPGSPRFGQPQAGDPYRSSGW